MDLQQTLTRAFVISFAFLMAIGAYYFQHNKGGSGLTLAVNNVVWVFFCLLIGLGLWKISASIKVVYSPYTTIILIALSLFILSLFYLNKVLKNIDKKKTEKIQDSLSAAIHMTKEVIQ